MEKIKIKDIELRQVPEIIETCMLQVEELRFKIERTKSPKNKRAHKRALDFFASIAYHLQENQPKT